MQNLAQELAAFKAQMLTEIPDEALDIMGQAGADLAASGLAERALSVGARAPDFTLANQNGTARSLADLLTQGPVIVSFYRGLWCPFCNLELHALQQALPEITALGARLVAISPQLPDNSLSTVKKHKLSFEVLSDIGNKVARDFGLVSRLSEPLRSVYEQFGIDLATTNGDDSFELPLAASYVIAQDGTIRFAFVSVDYAQRAEPADMLRVLKELG